MKIGYENRMMEHAFWTSVVEFEVYISISKTGSNLVFTASLCKKMRKFWKPSKVAADQYGKLTYPLRHVEQHACNAKAIVPIWQGLDSGIDSQQGHCIDRYQYI